MFTADDNMGDGIVDLRPLIAAVKLKKDLQGLHEGMNIRKIVATKENSFVKDSVIKVKNGHVVQEVCLKLKNVEKGQVELELKWQPRPWDMCFDYYQSFIKEQLVNENMI